MTESKSHNVIVYEFTLNKNQRVSKTNIHIFQQCLLKCETSFELWGLVRNSNVISSLFVFIVQTNWLFDSVSNAIYSPSILRTTSMLRTQAWEYFDTWITLISVRLKVFVRKFMAIFEAQSFHRVGLRFCAVKNWEQTIALNPFLSLHQWKYSQTYIKTQNRWFIKELSAKPVLFFFLWLYMRVCG